MDKRQSVLVTGVGGGVGQSILKSLQSSPYRVIGVDGENLGTGLYAVERAYRIPYASSSSYIPRLLELCKAENCRLIFPGLDAELPALASAKAAFDAAGVICVVSKPRVVEICDDKRLTAEFLSQNGLPAPRTALLTELREVEKIGFPMILKPLKGGHRSIGVHRISGVNELSQALEQLDTGGFVAQELIEGEEFTCGSVNLHNQCNGVIVMRRILRDGDTYKAFVVRDNAIEETVRKAAEALGPFGACNFQLRVRDGRSYIFEINARCSGTTYSRTLAGFNEPRMIADFLLNGVEPRHAIRDIAVLRYWKELVVDPAEIDRMTNDGRIDGEGRTL